MRAIMDSLSHGTDASDSSGSHRDETAFKGPKAHSFQMSFSSSGDEEERWLKKLRTRGKRFQEGILRLHSKSSNEATGQYLLWTTSRGKLTNDAPGSHLSFMHMKGTHALAFYSIFLTTVEIASSILVLHGNQQATHRSCRSMWSATAVSCVWPT